MSIDTPNNQPLVLTPDLEKFINDRVDALVTERVNAALKKDPAKNKLAIIASKGTLDMAYPPLILASAAAAMGEEAQIFFTFYGLQIIRKGGPRRLKVSPIGNPAMPVPVPNIVGMLPGMTPMATWMMKSLYFGRHNVATIQSLLQECIDLGVKLIACQMTLDVFGLKASDLIDGVEVGGAATFINFANEAHVSLFV
jgi:peroxiredoxin family protein